LAASTVAKPRGMDRAGDDLALSAIELASRLYARNRRSCGHGL